MLEWALGIGMTLNSVQDERILLVLINLLRIESNNSMALSDRYFNIRSEMLSSPEAIDLRELMAEINSPYVKCKFKQWSRGESGALNIREGKDSVSEGT